jgi:RNA polymerase sigma factor (sigma-70 family)
MTDGQLLECFVARRDEAAFEALVGRHGPMVLGVCRRLLRHEQDAEDAFQATFLVLVRRAASVGQRELLGNWLYGVAYRTALDARAAALRRRARERQVSPMPEPEAADTADVGRELRPLLDRELSRLPNKYRVPVVLCDLEGRTRRDVAGLLGIPAGTLSGRLTTARRMLARRLARRGGLALSAAALMAVLSPGAPAAGVPASLVARVVAAAAGQAAAAAPVVALADGVLWAMWFHTLKVAATAMLAVVVVGAAVAALLLGREPQGPDAPKVLKLGGNGRRVAWGPDGKTLAVAEIYEPLIYGKKGSAIKLWDAETGQMRQTLAESAGGGLAFQQVAFSADGKTIAATASEEVILPTMRQIRDVIKVWDAKTLDLRRTLDGDGQLVGVTLSADGKRVAAVNPGKKTASLWNAEKGALERTFKTGAAQPWSAVFSPDGKALMVGGQKGDGSGEVTQWDADTGHLKRALTTLANCLATAMAFSPDGTLVAASDGGELVQVWDAKTGEVLVSLMGSKGGHRTVAFSPDSQTVAAGGRDGTVRLWDVRTGTLKQTLRGHSAEVYAIAFSPDGKTLASVSQDQTARLWPIDGPDAETK